MDCRGLRGAARWIPGDNAALRNGATRRACAGGGIGRPLGDKLLCVRRVGGSDAFSCPQKNGGHFGGVRAAGRKLQVLAIKPLRNREAEAACLVSGSTVAFRASPSALM